MTFASTLSMSSLYARNFRPVMPSSSAQPRGFCCWIASPRSQHVSLRSSPVSHLNGPPPPRAVVHRFLTNDLHKVSTRRSALKSFTLSDGTAVRPGEWACTPVRSIMQSPEYFPDPLEFRGFRFAEQRETGTIDSKGVDFRQPSPSKLTDADHPWHVWGTGRMAW